ncbi:MAG TPA: SLATT domain-containing protein [Pyrinomonadaceae bacterium]|nr:SLATT domain-containing protein [Pyrinomonadaceae bacterium]
MSSNPTTNEDLLERWHKEVSRSRHAHYAASRYYSKRNYWIGVPAVILSAIVGSTVFATLKKEIDLIIRLSVGILSVSASVLTALQVFLGYSAKGEKHRSVAAKYGGIRRELEVLEEIKNSSTDFSTKLSDIEQRLTAISDEAPTVPENIWNDACQQFDLKT